MLIYFIWAVPLLSNEIKNKAPIVALWPLRFHFRNKKNGSTFHIPASSPWGQPWPWQLAVKHLLPRSARLGRRGRGLRRDRLPEDSVDDVGAVSRKLDEEESTSGVSAAAAASTILRRRRKETLGWSGSTSGCLQILRLSGGISTLEMRFWAM